MPLAEYLICEREEPTSTWKLRLERKERMKENIVSNYADFEKFE